MCIRDRAKVLGYLDPPADYPESYPESYPDAGESYAAADHAPAAAE